MTEIIFEIPKFINILTGLNYIKIIIASIIMVIAMELIIRIYSKHKNGKHDDNNVKHTFPRVQAYILILYTNVILRLTILGREVGSRNHSVSRFYFSLDEILSIHGLLNTMMFVPFGFLLYSIFKRYQALEKLVLTLLISMVFTISIELIQYLMEMGRFEISDIVCNTTGGLIGGLLAYLLVLLLKGSE